MNWSFPINSSLFKDDDDDDSDENVDNGFFFWQDAHEDDWYNKSLTALRMNNTHHGLSNPVLQYQAW